MGVLYIYDFSMEKSNIITLFACVVLPALDSISFFFHMFSGGWCNVIESGVDVKLKS